LFVHQGALGDFVILWPVLRALSLRFGPVDLLVPFSFGRLAVDLGLAAGHLPLEADWVVSLYGGPPHPEAIRRLAGYARAVVFSGNKALAQALARITKAPVVTALPRPTPRRPVHVLAFAIEQLAQAGLVLEPLPPAPVAHQPGSEGRVWLHPGAGSPRKRWPLECFVRLAAELAAAGSDPAFVTGPAENDLVAAIGSLTGDRWQIHQPATVGELAALLADGTAYIGNDGGPTHLAAALGLAVVAVFGPSDPRRWQPVGPAVTVVRPELTCRPCFETAPANCERPLCLDRTTVEEVLAALPSCLKTTAGRRCGRAGGRLGGDEAGIS